VSRGVRPNRIPNAKREKTLFLYEDHSLLDTLKNIGFGTQGLADASTALNEVTSKQAQKYGDSGDPRSASDSNSNKEGGPGRARSIARSRSASSDSKPTVIVC
jgi:actin-related protein 9